MALIANKLFQIIAEAPVRWTVGSFVAQTIVVQCGNAKLLGGKSNEEVAKAYPSLATPAGWAFSIWGLIYVWEAFVCGSMTLTAPESAEGLPWFVMANAFQLLWALVFSRDYINLSAGCLVGITGCLLGALETTSSTFLRLPLSLHAGWVTVASLLNANLVLVKANAPTNLQLAAAFATIYAGLGAAIVYGTLLRQLPLYTAAIAWACLGIYSNLNNAKKNALPDLHPDARSAFRLTTQAVTGITAHLAAASLLGQLLAS